MLRLVGGKMSRQSGSLLGVLLLLWVWLGTTAADGATWQSHNAAGLQAFQDGNVSEAVKRFESAFLQAGELSTADPKLGALLNNLILAYVAAAQYDKAKRAMDLWAKILAANSEEPWVAEQLGALKGVTAFLDKVQTSQREVSPGPQTTEPRYAVHLASMRSEEAAKAEWERLQTLYPEFLGRREPIMREIDMSDGGTFVRVLTGPYHSRVTAQDLCTKLGGREQYCAVVELGGGP